MMRREVRKPQDFEALVLSLLRAADRPLTAYDVQERAAAAGRRLYPMQAYRTLGRLIERGIVRRIEATRAFMLDVPGADAVTICTACGATQLHAVGGPLPDIARRLGDGDFAVRRLVVEALGECGACRDKA